MAPRLPTGRTRKRKFTATLSRVPGKGGWTYVIVPRELTPPITRGWGQTPVTATVAGVTWETSVWRTREGTGFLPVPKRIRGAKEEGHRVSVAFTFVDD